MSIHVSSRVNPGFNDALFNDRNKAELIAVVNKVRNGVLFSEIEACYPGIGIRMRPSDRERKTQLYPNPFTVFLSRLGLPRINHCGAGCDRMEE